MGCVSSRPAARALCLVVFCTPVFEASEHFENLCRLSCENPGPGMTPGTGNSTCRERCRAELLEEFIREQPEADPDAGTIAWIFNTGVLVFFMQPGFAFFEAGTCRRTHRAPLLRKNFMDAVICPLCFLVTISIWKPTPLYDDQGDQKADMVFFHALFCATSVTIASGAIAERIKLSAYFFYVVWMSGIVYPVIMVSAWGDAEDDLLFGVFRLPGMHPFHDAAGSGVVHMLGGVCGLVGASLLGRRIWLPPRSEEERDALYQRSGTAIPKQANRLRPEEVRLDWEQRRVGRTTRERLTVADEEKEFEADIPKQVIGTFLLAAGWFGFNCGSLHVGLAGNVALNTFLAWSSAGVATYVASYLFTACGKIENVPLGNVCNGSLCGLVAITAGCDVATAPVAVCVGAAAGASCPAFCWLVRLGVDDAVDASVVHGWGGFLGLLLVSVMQPGHCEGNVDILEAKQLLFCDEAYPDPSRFAPQFCGAVFIAVWGALWSLFVWCPFIIVECSREHQLRQLEKVIKVLFVKSAVQDINSIKNSIPNSWLSRRLVRDLRNTSPAGVPGHRLQKEFRKFQYDNKSECYAVKWLLGKCCGCSCFQSCSYISSCSVWSSFRASPREELEGLDLRLKHVLPVMVRGCFLDSITYWKRRGTKLKQLDQPKHWVIFGASIAGMFLALRLAHFNQRNKEMTGRTSYDYIEVQLVDERITQVGLDWQLTDDENRRDKAVVSLANDFIDALIGRDHFDEQDHAIFEAFRPTEGGAKQPEDTQYDMENVLFRHLRRFACINVRSASFQHVLKEVMGRPEPHVVVLADDTSPPSSDLKESLGVKIDLPWKQWGNIDYTFSFDYVGTTFDRADFLEALNYGQTKFFLHSSATDRGREPPIPDQPRNCTLSFRVSQDRYDEIKESSCAWPGPEWMSREICEAKRYFFQNQFGRAHHIKKVPAESGCRTAFSTVHDSRLLFVAIGSRAISPSPSSVSRFYSELEGADALAWTWFRSLQPGEHFVDKVESSFKNHMERLAQQEVEMSEPWLLFPPTEPILKGQNNPQKQLKNNINNWFVLIFGQKEGVAEELFMEKVRGLDVTTVAAMNIAPKQEFDVTPGTTDKLSVALLEGDIVVGRPWKQLMRRDPIFLAY